MNKMINFRSSRTRMFLLAIVDILTIVLNSYLALIVRYELHYGWIPQEYIHSIQLYMLINIATTLLLYLIPVFSA